MQNMWRNYFLDRIELTTLAGSILYFCVCDCVCQAMWLMLQQDTAQDFVIATGVAHSVREFVLAAFQHIGVDIVSVFTAFSLCDNNNNTNIHISVLL